MSYRRGKVGENVKRILKKLCSGVLASVMLVSGAAPVAASVWASMDYPASQVADIGDCKLPEHQHTAACYADTEIEWACEEQYGGTDVMHRHNDVCYDTTGQLICYLDEFGDGAESGIHVHDESCLISGPAGLICGQDEHVHDETCFPAQMADVTEIVSDAEPESGEVRVEAIQEPAEVMGAQPSVNYTATSPAARTTGLETGYKITLPINYQRCGGGVAQAYSKFSIEPVDSAFNAIGEVFECTVENEARPYIYVDPAKYRNGTYTLLYKVNQIGTEDVSWRVWDEYCIFEITLKCGSSGPTSHEVRFWRPQIGENRPSSVPDWPCYFWPRQYGRLATERQEHPDVDDSVFPDTWDYLSEKDKTLVDEILSEMSTEEKVGQLLLAHWPEDGAGTAQQAINMAKAYHLGGYIMYNPMFEGATPDSVRAKIDAVQDAVGIDMIMSVDEEGGRVVRISNKPAFWTDEITGPIPSLRTVYNTNSAQSYLEAQARKMAKLLKDLHINVNHAPVVDIAGSGSYMYDRTASSSGVVNRWVGVIYNQQFQAEGIGSTLKHFPGYGNTVDDSHTGLAYNTKTLDSMERSDFLPYYGGFWQNHELCVKSVMVTHNIVTALDENTPASISSATYDLLRDYFGFDGVALTDDVGMAGLMNITGSGNQAVYAISAGADMVICSDADVQYAALLAAVRNGTISEARLNEAVTRILKWKADLGILGSYVFGAEDGQEAEVMYKSDDGKDEFAATFEYAWEYLNKNLSDNEIPGYLTLLKDVELTHGIIYDTHAYHESALYYNGYHLKFVGTDYGLWVKNGSFRLYAGNASYSSHPITGRPMYWLVKGNPTPVTSSVTKSGWDQDTETLYFQSMDDRGVLSYYEVGHRGLGGVIGTNMNGQVLKVSGGRLYCKGGYITGDYGGVLQEDKGSFTLDSASIVGCSNAPGILNRGAWKVECVGDTSWENNTSGVKYCYYIGGNQAGGICIENGSLCTGRLNALYGLPLGYIVANYFPSNGAGICFNNVALSSDSYIIDTVCADNVSDGNGGALYWNVGSPYFPNEQLSIINAKFALNRAQNGGAIAVDPIYATNEGYSVKIEEVSINNSEFFGNRAVYDGGAVYVPGDARLYLKKSAVYYNEAGRYGGGIAVNNENADRHFIRADIAGTNIMSNKAIYGGGISLCDEVHDGPNGQPSDCYVWLSENSRVFANYAVLNGGGVFASGWNTYLVFEDAYARNNAVGLNGLGAGVYCDNGTVGVTGAVYIENNGGSRYTPLHSNPTTWPVVPVLAGQRSNLYLTKEYAVVTDDALDQLSTIFVTPGEWPESGNTFAVTRKQLHIPMVFYSDRDDYITETSDVNSSYYYILIGDVETVNDRINETFEGIEFQHYAEILSIDLSDGVSPHKPNVIDTSGGVMPKLVDTRGDTSGFKVKTLTIENDKIKMRSDMSAIYSSVREVDDLDLSRHLHSETDNYKVKEIWVTDLIDKRNEITSDGWTVYPWSEDLYLTQDSADANKNAIYIGTKAVVRYVYDSQTGSKNFKTNFWDIDITNGDVPVRTYAADGKPSTTITYDPKGKGINDYSGLVLAKRALEFGNGMCLVHGITGQKDSYSTYNYYGYNGVAFDLVQGLDENGNLIYRDPVSERTYCYGEGDQFTTGWFNEGPTPGKTLISGHDLVFDTNGDTCILKSVSGTDLTNLDTFRSMQNWNKTSTIYYNNFWPMDWAPTWGAAGHDPKFGNSTYKDYTKISTGGAFPVSDDGQHHNFYFTMHTELEFELSSDYIAPMSCLFFGDDDLYMFLDGRLIMDLGGVHGAVGEYVNLRDYLPVGSFGKHTLSVFYVERGGSGSTCYLQFQLPNSVTSVTPPASDDDTVGTVSLGKTVTNISTARDILDTEFEFHVDIMNSDGTTLTGTYPMYNADNQRLGTFSPGDTVKLAHGDMIEIRGLPVGAVVTATETLPGAIQGVWWQDEELSVLTGTIQHGKMLELMAYNKYVPKQFVVPTTGGPGVPGYYAAGFVFLIPASIILFCPYKKRRR